MQLAITIRWMPNRTSCPAIDDPAAFTHVSSIYMRGLDDECEQVEVEPRCLPIADYVATLFCFKGYDYMQQLPSGMYAAKATFDTCPDPVALGGPVDDVYLVPAVGSGEPASHCESKQYVCPPL